MGVTWRFVAVTAIAVGAVGGCGSSEREQVADLQAQLDAANARAEAAEAERDEFAADLDAAESVTEATETTVPEVVETPTPDTTATETTVAEVVETTLPVTTTPPATAVPMAQIAAPDASPYVAGFGDLSVLQLPDGEPGEVTVIVAATKLDSSGSLPIIVRNNTGADVGRIEVTGRARNNGELAASGSSQGFEPAVVQPGEIAWGYVYFDYDGVPDSTTFELSVSTDPPDDYFLGAPVIEVANTGTSIVGLAANDTSNLISGPVSVSVACFDTAGNYAGTAGSFTAEEEIPAGGNASFQVDLYDDACDIGLVGASGYGF